MSKKYIGTNPLYVETSDITEIENVICEQLNVGDLVVKTNALGEKEAYRVSSHTPTSLSMVYADDEKVIKVSYEKGEQGWVYDETTETELGKSGLEEIEWNGTRKFTEAEIEKLAQMKAYVRYGQMLYFTSYNGDGTLDLFSLDVYGDDVSSIDFYCIVIIADKEDEEYGKGEPFDSTLAVLLNNWEGKGTKLYKHTIWNDGDEFWFVSAEKTPIEANNYQMLVDKINKTSLNGYCCMAVNGDYGSPIKMGVAYISSNKMHVSGFSTTGDESEEDISTSLTFTDSVEAL